jgi:FMN-dependent oxidoreductase (nitrilotriacetate monooxygenase family)
MSNKKQLHLGVLMTYAGIHAGAWRHPSTKSDLLLEQSLYREFAQIAERGKLDAILIVEVLSLTERNKKLAEDFPIPSPDVMSALAVMAAATSKIGLTGTMNTTYNDPFHVASKFSALDHISAGRAGWNMVTSQDPNAPFNYSRDGQMDHSVRYERAGEFIDLVKKYWDSWEDDAVRADKKSGIYLDESKVHTVEHEGKFFSVHGKSNFPRPVQGYPVLFQAGSSESGMKLAAQQAEVVFTAQDNVQDALAFYKKLKGSLPTYGRHDDELVILPGISPILGSTEWEAKQLEEQFNELILPEIAVKRLSALLDFDLSSYPIDGPVPFSEINVEANVTKKSRVQLLKDLAEREKLSIRQLSKHTNGGSGHFPFVGTPEQLADFMEHWLEAGACDGFNILISHFVEGLEVLVDHTIPILQRRGLHRTEYTGNTLRDHLGLARPVNPWTR